MSKKYLVGFLLLFNLAARAGDVTLIWDYDFFQSAGVDSFRIYVAPGLNTPFQPGNANAVRVMNMAVGAQVGFIPNIKFIIPGLPPGSWTFTVTAITTTGMESDNATPVSTTIPSDKPAPPQLLRI